MKVSRMTFTGNRDNRKFNRIRGGYCLAGNLNRIAKIISYRNHKNGNISVSLLVDNGNKKEHDWQMIRQYIPDNRKEIRSVSKKDAEALFSFQKAFSLFVKEAGPDFLIG